MQMYLRPIYEQCYVIHYIFYPVKNIANLVMQAEAVSLAYIFGEGGGRSYSKSTIITQGSFTGTLVRASIILSIATTTNVQSV